MDVAKVLLVVLFILVSVSTSFSAEGAVDEEPIRIDGDEYFEVWADSEGWDGDGSADDPWVIEGYSIDGRGMGYGIYIGNVTDHFIVRGCHVYNSSGRIGEYYENSDIYIYNSKNGVVEGNMLTNRVGHGINIVDSEDIDVVENEVYGEVIMDAEGHSINIERSRAINVTGNHIEGREEVYTLEHGIFVMDSSEVVIEDNQIEENDHFGIGFFRSDNNVVKGNWVTENSWGVHLEGSSNNLIIKNVLLQNGWGVYLEESEYDGSSKNNSIYQNDFVRNGRPAWDDYGSIWEDRNLWDNGTTGNYWSDYRIKYPQEEEPNDHWQTPYEVPGSEENNFDRYPAVEPYWYDEDADEPGGIGGMHLVWWVVFGVIVALIALRTLIWIRRKHGVEVEN